MSCTVHLYTVWEYMISNVQVGVQVCDVCVCGGICVGVCGWNM